MDVAASKWEHVGIRSNISISDGSFHTYILSITAATQAVNKVLLV